MNISEALQEIYDRRGELTAQIVVDEARVARTRAGKTLHEHLEWNDEIAGDAWRIEQAGQLIRKARVRYEQGDENKESKDIRIFVSVPREDGGRTYMPTEEVAQDPFASKLVLAEAEREWRSLKRRYEHMSDFMDMVRRDLEAA